ncbi:MAG TPA: DUF2203 domain-containing protein [Terriglobia bacterium]
MAERYFERDEAEELLPVITNVLGEAREQKQSMDSLDRELAHAAAKIMVLGGWIPPHRELAEKRARRELAKEKITEAIKQIHEIGCVVKDLDEGLVDFPTLREGREVYLCWKLGEERIGYWHGLDEGFAGRKPLNADGPEPEEPPPGPGRVQ